MLNVAVLGCGKIAQVRHIPEYAANDRVSLAGFYNPTASRAEEMAAKYGGKVYSSPEELLADPEVEAVSVCAANYAHASLTIASLEAGKHVLCEKPMATTEEDCEAMILAAEKAGKRLLVAQNQRLAKAHVVAKKLLSEGLIEEARRLYPLFFQEGKTDSFTAAQGIGYKELFSWLSGEISLEEAVRLIKRNTRRFAKRQLTWFRRERNVTWINIDEGDPLDEIRKHIQIVWGG